MATTQSAAKNQASIQNQVAEVQVEVPYELQDKIRYNIPAICTCCMTPTENKATAKWSFSRKYVSAGGYHVRESQSASLDFCVCPDCVAHEKEFNKKRMRMIKISILVSSIISALTAFLFSDTLALLFGSNEILNFSIAIFLLPLILVMLMLAICDYILPQRVLDHRHTSRTKGVRLLGPRRYEFDNLRYAQLFIQRNGEGGKFTDSIGKVYNSPYKMSQKIKTTSINYKIFGKSLLEGKPLIEIFGLSAILSMVLTLIFSLMLVGMFTPPMGGSPGSYVCSGFLVLVIMNLFMDAGKENK